MRETTPFEKIDLHLIRVLHTVIAERSVSRAAVRLGMHQPAVSTALKRLRDLSGDPILVRSGTAMQRCACWSHQRPSCKRLKTFLRKRGHLIRV